jgi:uncharacterized protein with PIN domain
LENEEVKILVDQMYQNVYTALKKIGYDVTSVDNLVAEGKPMKSDYSILKYAEKNRMVLITRDGQNKKGCEENGISCVSLGENTDINKVRAELEMIKARQTAT